MVTTQLNMVRLGDKSLILRGGSPRPIQNYITTAPDGINWIKIGDVSISDKYIRKTNEKIKPSGVAMSRVVNPGDLILSNSMSFGRPYILQISGCIHDGWLVIQNYQDTFEPEYLLYALGSEFVKKQYIAMAAGSSVQNLNKEKVSDVVLWAPQKTEQKQILQALSDIDSLIDNTEKLIEKKKAIKQGVMQELLTGKRRLPGFSGEWRECTLDQIGSFRKGASISRDESQTGDIPAVRYGELYTVHNDYIKEYTSHISQDIAEKSVKVKKNDILFTASGETKEDIGKCAAIVDDFTVYAGGDLIIFTPSIEISPVFFGTRLNHSDANKYKSLNGQGDSVVHISATVLGKMLISYPIDIKEQEALSSVIYDMDKEIETLTEQLQKYRNIKTGMMSKLLTGEICLAE